jgi:ribonuclease-3
MNKIKKDSVFVESLFAAKALREGEVAQTESSEPNQDQTQMPITEKKVEAYRRTDQLEDIISAAEEAAYSEIE